MANKAALSLALACNRVVLVDVVLVVALPLADPARGPTVVVGSGFTAKIGLDAAVFLGTADWSVVG